MSRPRGCSCWSAVLSDTSRHLKLWLTHVCLKYSTLACLQWERSLRRGGSIITDVIILHQNPKGQTGDVVSSTQGERITKPLAKRRLTKTGRLNNTSITFWEAGGQVHVKSITSKVSSAQLISPHTRHTLLEICVEDVLILLVLPFSQAHKQSRRITGSAAKQPPPPPSPIKQNNKLAACQNNPSTFVCVCVYVCVCVRTFCLRAACANALLFASFHFNRWK